MVSLDVQRRGQSKRRVRAEERAKRGEFECEWKVLRRNREAFSSASYKFAKYRF
jgi:hypothetical protein